MCSLLNQASSPYKLEDACLGCQLHIQEKILMLHDPWVWQTKSAFPHAYFVFPILQFKRQVSYFRWGLWYHFVIMLPYFYLEQTPPKKESKEGSSISVIVPVSLQEYGTSKHAISSSHSIPNPAALTLLMAFAPYLVSPHEEAMPLPTCRKFSPKHSGCHF